MVISSGSPKLIRSKLHGPCNIRLVEEGTAIDSFDSAIDREGGFDDTLGDVQELAKGVISEFSELVGVAGVK